MVCSPIPIHDCVAMGDIDFKHFDNNFKQANLTLNLNPNITIRTFLFSRFKAIIFTLLGNETISLT